MTPSEHREDEAHPSSGAADARTSPARPDERGGEAERTDRAAAAAERRAPQERSRGTSAEAPEEIAGRPGTTQHVPPDGVPPGAERRDPTQGGGRTGGGGSKG